MPKENNNIEEILVNVHEKDNLYICIKDTADFKVGKKYALKDIKEGDKIFKLGNQIGNALEDINIFEELNEFNVGISNAHNYDFELQGINFENEDDLESSFYGYDNGTYGVATRKCLLVISLVSCANSAVRIIEEELNHIDVIKNGDIEVIPIIHSNGCGHNGQDLNLEVLQRLIEGYILNPNCFGAVIIGLGCESNNFLESSDSLKKVIYRNTIQNFSSFQDLSKNVIDEVIIKLDAIQSIKRKKFGLDKLKVALQCGGSDGLSGITANPVLGGAIDLLINNNGSAILSETPETFGAHANFINRIPNDSNRKKFMKIVDRWDQGLNLINIENNPSIGNKEGGLSNIYEKSLGAVQKGGSSKIQEILEFGEKSSIRTGLTFMDSPGYDPCSLTGQIASGANMICFTTGRGSSYDNSFVPVIKISSNRSMFERMSMFMDFDASAVLKSSSYRELSRDLYTEILNYASGKQTINENERIKTSEFIPWNRGGMV